MHVAHIIEEVLIIAWLFAQTTFPLWGLNSDLKHAEDILLCAAGWRLKSKYWKASVLRCAGQPMQLGRYYGHPSHAENKAPIEGSRRCWCCVRSPNKNQEANKMNLCRSWRQKSKPLHFSINCQSSQQNNLS